MKRVLESRDYDKERWASEAYEKLRQLDMTELRMEARFNGINPAGLSRQQVIFCIIERSSDSNA